MNRNLTHTDHIRNIAESVMFLSHAETDQEYLIRSLGDYSDIVNTNSKIFSKFPNLISEIQAGMTLEHFNSTTSADRINHLQQNLPLLTYISDMLNDLH